MVKDILNLDDQSQITLLTKIWDLQETVENTLQGEVPQEITEKLYELEAAIRYSGIVTEFKTLEEDV